MTPRTFRATLYRSTDNELNAMDFEVEVTVEYEWIPADAHGDATAEIIGATDDEGRDWPLSTQEEVRLSRLAESYATNPVQTVRA